MNFLKDSKKSVEVKALLNQALRVLSAVGIPLENKTSKALEKMAACFMALVGVRLSWEAVNWEKKSPMNTREIIRYINAHFEEHLALSSYDDIRRKHLKPLVLAGLVINSGQERGSATNAANRGYALSDEFLQLLSTLGTDHWQSAVARFMDGRIALSDILARKRDLERMSVLLPEGKILSLSPGRHNALQKAIIEEFLPRFGSHSQVLYIGDTSEKFLHLEEAELRALRCLPPSHEQLPDIIAFSPSRNRLFLIEAVHSTGPINEIRRLELNQLVVETSAEVIFVTCFLTKKDFKKWLLEIAWETEVWIAENPDHMVHFNGHKFLGAH